MHAFPGHPERYTPLAAALRALELRCRTTAAQAVACVCAEIDINDKHQYLLDHTQIIRYNFYYYYNYYYHFYD
jgi:hypothetical protein